jgi:hypothetical protein
MPIDTNSKTKDVRLAMLVAALVALGGLAPLAWHYYGPEHRAAPGQDKVATAPTPAPVPAPAPAQAPATEADNEVAPPAPPGAEVVPPEESETDRGATSASPAGPTLSNGRAAGLHLAPDPLHLNSSAALVMDQDTRQVLAQKNDGAVLPMASLTKLMTTLLVLEAKQPMDEVLTITEEDVDNERHSRSRLRVGATLTREEAAAPGPDVQREPRRPCAGTNLSRRLPKLVEAMNRAGPSARHGQHQLRRSDRPLEPQPVHRAGPRQAGGRGVAQPGPPRVLDHARACRFAGRTHPAVPQLQPAGARPQRGLGHPAAEDRLHRGGGALPDDGGAGGRPQPGHGAAGRGLQRRPAGRCAAPAQVGGGAERLAGRAAGAGQAAAEPPRARVAAAKDKRGKSEQVASAKSRKAERPTRADKAAAKKGGKTARTEVAAKKTKPSKDVAVAKKPDAKKDRGGRVRHTFAAGRSEEKG